ncbi:MAG: ABC-F family ATP-binding cassette domain-containing protein [Candidatus Limimorpha sp.]|nr:ABC-F family ATP-binding cassette domain-containing protein [Bacteroidales bacterium]MCI7377411.1 ABC-F family ATP-binding cassette domain-containing protein [Bacteroidales bacterium]MDD7277580.1 ABC-F family ATP-binding cassette domain-containing protein [Bacteroidales bacterium]MDY6076005.1 ABC-F family ATP-binding cassette domain-containing protein [Bacteroidales bacterium]
MISIQNLSMHFTGQDLFTDINFLIREKDRIGLVGKNGAGKTTLIRMIAGLEQPTHGSVVMSDDVTVGYLPQEMNIYSSKSVLEETMTAFEEVHRLEDEIVKIQDELSNREDYESAAYQRLCDKLSYLNERLVLMGGHSAEGEAERILVGLGFDHEDMSRMMSEFSNGWQMRVELAKILLRKPSLLLLDEPTNHLDIESIQWLEGYLKNYYGAIFMVSHDRAFLDHITIRTIEISGAKIYDYKCSYSEFVERREERIDLQKAAYDNQQREIKEIESFIERFRYKATKAKQVQSRVKQLEKMNIVEIDDRDKSVMHFKFPPAPHSGKVTLDINNVSKSYGDKIILENIKLLIPRGEKIAFVGRNGEGKSTLSKIIAGVIDYDGEVKLGHEVKIGYYAQNQQDMLDPEKTVFETLDDVAVGEMRVKVKSLLGAFLFSGETIDKKVKVLSGGEKARLSLAKMLLFPTNLLVLDEPTNHLDMLSKDILKSALLQFDGTLIVVSHDRDFLQGLTTKVYEFKKPHIKEYIGDIYDFLEAKRIKELDELNKKQGARQESVSVSQNRIDYEAKKKEDREKKRVEKEIKMLEDKIDALEKELAHLDEIMANPSAYQDVQVNDDFYWAYGKKKEELQYLIDKWGEVAM